MFDRGAGSGEGDHHLSQREERDVRVIPQPLDLVLRCGRVAATEPRFDRGAVDLTEQHLDRQAALVVVTEPAQLLEGRVQCAERPTRPQRDDPGLEAQLGQDQREALLGELRREASVAVQPLRGGPVAQHQRPQRFLEVEVVEQVEGSEQPIDVAEHLAEQRPADRRQAIASAWPSSASSPMRPRISAAGEVSPLVQAATPRCRMVISSSCTSPEARKPSHADNSSVPIWVWWKLRNDKASASSATGWSRSSDGSSRTHPPSTGRGTWG